MRINFDLQNGQKTEQQKNGYVGKDSYLVNEGARAASFLNRQTVLDISGKVTDDFNYGDQGRFTEKVMQAASVDEYMLLQRNFNAVMSNSMSGKDFMAMEEEGFDVYNMEPDEAITILDKIKSVLAQSGNEIAGYNDDLSVKQLEEITGNSGYARKIAKALEKADAPVTEENIRRIEEVLEKAATLTLPGEGNTAYLLSRNLEPTLGNLYKASYSSVNLAYTGRNTGYATGSYGRQGENLQDIRKTLVSQSDYAKLADQLRQRVQDSGLEVNTTNLDAAKWLVEKGFPLNKESLSLYHNIQNISFPLDPEMITRQAAQAISEGRSPWDITLTGEQRSIYEQASEVYERYQKLPLEAADYAVSNNLSLSLSNMEGYYSIEGSFTVQIQARKTLEEVRLKMTVEANLKLLQSGITIDTAPMEELIAQLDAAGKQWEKSLFGSDSASGKGELFLKTMDQVRELPGMPLALVGRISVRNSITLQETYQEGQDLQTRYQAAHESYEALMTQPRRDLGDSIRMAFRNVDDILQDMQLELSEENRRAVRILGYNRMEISQENLLRVQEADRRVQDVIEGLKPGLTLEMIRQGKNPLEMTLDELQEYILEKEDDFDQDTTKFSKFLYKLDKQGEITKEERQAYIGIYRLLRQVEKSDGAVIGSLVAQGADLNLSNLLSAVRTRKAKPTDIRVDDSVGVLQKLEIRGTSISDQIEAGFDRIKDELKGEKSLEQLAREVEKIVGDTKAEEDYAQENLQQIRKIIENNPSMADYLKTYNQPVTIANLQSAGVLTNQRGKTFQQIQKWEEAFLEEQEGRKEESVFGFLEKAEEFINRLDESEKREESYQSIIEEASQVLENAVMHLGDEAGYVDIRGIRQLYKQLNLASNLSREENYEIPVQIGGEVTSINLKIIHQAETAGEVKVTLDTEKLGKVEARFTVSINTLEGSVLTEYMDKKDILQNQAEALNEAISQALEETKIEMKEILFGSSSGLNINHAEPANIKQAADTAILYKVAKGFITFIKTL